MAGRGRADGRLRSDYKCCSSHDWRFPLLHCTPSPRRTFSINVDCFTNSILSSLCGNRASLRAYHGSRRRCISLIRDPQNMSRPRNISCYPRDERSLAIPEAVSSIFCCLSISSAVIPVPYLRTPLTAPTQVAWILFAAPFRRSRGQPSQQVASGLLRLRPFLGPSDWWLSFTWPPSREQPRPLLHLLLVLLGQSLNTNVGCSVRTRKGDNKHFPTVSRKLMIHVRRVCHVQNTN